PVLCSTGCAPRRRPRSTSMPTRTKRTPTRTTSPRAKTKTVKAPSANPVVLAFLQALEHPLKAEIQRVRQLILDASPHIREGIKWTAPSFRTTEFFATFHLRARDSVQLVLHTGAKVKDLPANGLQIADPEGLLKWLARDRCLVTFSDGKDIQARGPALQALL